MAVSFDYLMTARSVTDAKFDDEPGDVQFLRVARSAQTYAPSDAAAGNGDLQAWVDEVVGLADGDENPNSISPAGDILVFVHGYNNDAKIADLAQRTHATKAALERGRATAGGKDLTRLMALTDTLSEFTPIN